MIFSFCVELNLFVGDCVLLVGKLAKTTVCVVVTEDGFEKEKIGISMGIRNNLRVKLGDVITVRGIETIHNLSAVHLLPFADTCEGLTGDIFASHLRPYFIDACRPVTKGTFKLWWYIFKTGVYLLLL